MVSYRPLDAPQWSVRPLCYLTRVDIYVFKFIYIYTYNLICQGKNVLPTNIQFKFTYFLPLCLATTMTWTTPVLQAEYSLYIIYRNHFFKFKVIVS